MSELLVGINDDPLAHDAQPPTARVQHGINWGPWLDGATIASSTWNHDAALTVTDLGVINDVHLGLVTGGVVGTIYTIESDIETVANERRRKSFLLEILPEPTV